MHNMKRNSYLFDGFFMSNHRLFRLVILPFFCVLFDWSETSGQQQFVHIYPEQHNQQFLGGGVGFGNYWAHIVNGQSVVNQQVIYDWLFEDLDLEYIRFVMKADMEILNDNADPLFLSYGNLNLESSNHLDGAAEIYNAAFGRNNSVKTMFYAQDYPDFLKTFNNNGDISGLDYDNPNLYEEIAEWVFANMVYLSLNHGMYVDVVDLLNEPDLKPWLNRQTSAEIFRNVVPALELLVLTNPQLYNGPMPKIIGPSCVNLDKSADWVEIWESDGTLDYIDIISGHLYGGSWPQEDEPRNYRRLNIVQGNKQFTQNEAHPGQAVNNSSRLPADNLDDQHEGSLIFSAWMCLGLNNGIDVFHYFAGNNPSATNLASLTHTPWGGTPSRKKQYFAYRQFTGLIHDDPYRCNFDMEAPSSYYATTLHPEGENYVLLNIVNLNSSSRNFTLQLFDNAGQPLNIVRVEDFKTNGDSNIELVADTTYDTPVDSTNRWFAGETLRSLIIHYQPSDWNEFEYENFENDWGIWIDGGSNARRNASDADFASRGNFCVRIRGNSDSSNIATENIDLSQASRVQLNFSYHCRNMDTSNDGFCLQVSNDGGSNYRTVKCWNFVDDFVNDEFYNVTVDIRERRRGLYSRNKDQIYIPRFTENTRFRFVGEADSNSDYVYIDSISIRNQ